MKLSVIIVNYNVKYFLEQCLYSVIKACKDSATEILVVDNNSVDGSVEMVREKFPEVLLIENKANKGFSSANNQAIRIAAGEYVLLLNPDTLVEEDTFEKVIRFMNEHTQAGGLGIKMIDGSGKFLPESKRGFPSPSVAFYKISGLSFLFPKSKIFGKYHLGYLDNEKTHEIDVLSGAFMLLRKTALDKVGLLDESFFMYGEDIDLSYRIVKGGYKNYYFPGARIIHYKGESTKKSSINYVFVFYQAMIIFAKKHFSQQNARLFSFFIHFAIYIRASFAIFSRFLKKILLPSLDTFSILGGLYLLKTYWEHYIKIDKGVHYPTEFMTIAVPGYISIWLLSVYLSGGYDHPIRLTKIIRGIFTGTILILVIYALLPETLRFSRALILLGAAWGVISMILLRLVINLFGNKEYELENQNKKKLVIVGDIEEGNRVLALLKLSNAKTTFIGFVKPVKNNAEEETKGIYQPLSSENHYLGTIEQLKEVIEVYQVQEIIFCAKDVAAQQIIDQMSVLGSRELEYKIAPPESLYIIGSNSVDNPGDLYIIDINAINKPLNKRNKRLLDIVVSLFLLVTAPIVVFLIKSPLGLIKNIFFVLSGKRSWVGYTKGVKNPVGLPSLKEGVLSPLDTIKNKNIDDITIDKLNKLYAKDYKAYNDLNIISKGLRFLGRD
jgi:O-antigen biosynthesis protein